LSIGDVPVVGLFLDRYRDMKPKAGRRYYYAFKAYCRWLEEKLGVRKDVEQLTLDDLKPSLVEWYMSGVTNPHTANTFLSACKSLLSFVKKEFLPKSMEDFAYITTFEGAFSRIKFRDTSTIPFGESLSEEKFSELLELVSEDDFMFSATVVHFYFGARPIELARRFREVNVDEDDVREIIKRYGTAFVDFDKGLIAIPIAKTEKGVRILPFDPVREHVERWVNGIDAVLSYKEDRRDEWFTKRIKKYSKVLGVRVTAYTARKTIRTFLDKLGVEEWEKKYWMGHKTGVPGKYRDVRELMPKLRRDIAERHYVVSALRARRNRLHGIS